MQHHTHNDSCANRKRKKKTTRKYHPVMLAVMRFLFGLFSTQYTSFGALVCVRAEICQNAVRSGRKKPIKSDLNTNGETVNANTWPTKQTHSAADRITKHSTTIHLIYLKMFDWLQWNCSHTRWSHVETREQVHDALDKLVLHYLFNCYIISTRQFSPFERSPDKRLPA